jgi:hypothetical protein
MDPFEAHTHSFIIKIWREETSTETGAAIWRGHMTHVPGGERRYLAHLNDITAFINPYLEGMGVKVETGRRGPHWWERWKQGI